MKKSAKILGLLGMLSAMTGIGAEAGVSMASPTAITDSKKKSTKTSVLQGNIPRVVRESKRDSHGQGAYRHKKNGFLDQTRKREKLRRNPSFARSKKCTTRIK
jgi:hypothetical protein